MTAEKRTLNQIAREIKQNWNKQNSGTELYFGAKPYLDAMYSLYDIKDNYGCDSGKSIVAYFLANAQTWKGPVAREIKKELNAMLKSK
jgi:hypothetical protein